MKTTFNTQYFIILTLAFIVFTAIGTVSHEYGHILVAKYFGYETSLHYGSMNYNSDLNEELVEIHIQNKTAIENDEYFDKKNEYKIGIKKLQSNGLWITIGGPLQTILTGLIGLTILFIRKSQIRAIGLNIIDWLAIFLSLFWLREVFNLVTSVGSEIISPVGSYFGGDEKIISLGLNLWEGTIPIILGLFGILISLFIIFKIIPNRLRLTFILSGLIGGITGFILWMDIIGPKILP
jgi:hypothetical protein